MTPALSSSPRSPTRAPQRPSLALSDRGHHAREATVDVSVTLGNPDEGIVVEVSDDTAFTPELASDLLRRAADTALRLHADLHPANDAG